MGPHQNHSGQGGNRRREGLVRRRGHPVRVVAVRRHRTSPASWLPQIPSWPSRWPKILTTLSSWASPVKSPNASSRTPDQQDHRDPPRVGTCLVAGLLERAHEYNADGSKPPFVERLRIFGRYLRLDVDPLGDVDVELIFGRRITDPKAIHDYTKASGGMFGSYIDQLMWPQKELVQHLRNRSAALNITLEDVRSAAQGNRSDRQRCGRLTLQRSGVREGGQGHARSQAPGRGWLQRLQVGVT